MNKNSKHVSAINMAFGGGKENKEVVFDKYIGIAPFFIVAVNPNLAELQKLYPGRQFDKEPDYSYEKNVDGKIEKGIFITLYLKSNPEHKESRGIEVLLRASYLLKEDTYYNKDKSKVQIINDYGDTGWVSVEDFKAGVLPEYLIKQSFITDGMKPALVGESDLVDMLKMFIGIPGSRNYKDGVWSPKTKEELTKDCIAGFSKAELTQLLSGNVSSIKNAIKSQPDNQIKYLVGVRTSNDKEYQEVCTKIPVRFGTADYKKVDAALQEMKANGAFGSSVFGVYPFTFQKYEVASTTFTPNSNQAPEGDDPFAGFGELQ